MTGKLRFMKAAFGALMLSFVLVVGGCQAPSSARKNKEIQLIWPSPPTEPRFTFEQMIRGSVDVVKLTSAERFKLFATGAGVFGKALDKPYGVVARDGVLYVGDTVARLVHVFDLNKRTYRTIGESGAGALRKPLGIAMDDAKNLYVCDASLKRVMIYNAKGKFVRSINGKTLFSRPTGLAVSKDGSRIFVVDTGGVGSIKHHVLVFDRNGRHLYDIGKRGSKPGEFNLPLNAAIGPDGTLYVVDGGNFRIEAFTQKGKFLFSFGAIGTRTGQFARPKSVAVDKHNNLYVSDAAFGNVQIFNHDGGLLMWIGTRGATNHPGRFMLPSGLAVDDSDGRIYVTDQFFRKVEVYRPSGAPARILASASKG